MAAVKSPPTRMEVDPRNQAGLTPPASDESDKNDKKDDSGSELSDLEEPTSEIEPDHYWDGGSVPVFKPVGNPFPAQYRFREFVLASSDTDQRLKLRQWINFAVSSHSCRKSTSMG